MRDFWSQHEHVTAVSASAAMSSACKPANKVIQLIGDEPATFNWPIFGLNIPS